MSLKSLLIDTSTNVFQIGVLKENYFLDFFSSNDNALPDFFSLLTPILDNYTFEEVIFCQGPGKLIGIRTALMFLRVLKIIHPEIKIYSYNNLSLAHKILNPLPVNVPKIDLLTENSTENVSRITFVTQYSMREKIVCVRKNRSQYYVYSKGEIVIVDRKNLEMYGNPIYCLVTHDNVLLDATLIPMKYDLKECAEIIRSITSPSDAIETKFDPQGEYKKWKPK
jgi:tRNA A37 threonylcarbamoyladenosine modification protein TsaB